MRHNHETGAALPPDLCERLDLAFAGDIGLQLYDDVEPDDEDDCEWIDPRTMSYMSRYNVPPRR